MTDFPAYRHIGTLHVEIAAPLIAGSVKGRTRACVPITGGTLTGPAINGTILPGGYDWAWLYEGGMADVDARYVIALDDGGFATVTNRGTCYPVEGAEDAFHGRSVPVFETGSEKYAWLNTGPFLCTFVSLMTDGFVALELFMTE